MKHISLFINGCSELFSPVLGKFFCYPYMRGYRYSGRSLGFRRASRHPLRTTVDLLEASVGQVSDYNSLIRTPLYRVRDASDKLITGK